MCTKHVWKRRQAQTNRPVGTLRAWHACLVWSSLGHWPLDESQRAPRQASDGYSAPWCTLGGERISPWQAHSISWGLGTRLTYLQEYFNDYLYKQYINVPENCSLCTVVLMYIMSSRQIGNPPFWLIQLHCTNKWGCHKNRNIQYVVTENISCHVHVHVVILFFFTLQHKSHSLILLLCDGKTVMYQPTISLANYM